MSAPINRLQWRGRDPLAIYGEHYALDLQQVPRVVNGKRLTLEKRQEWYRIKKLRKP